MLCFEGGTRTLPLLLLLYMKNESRNSFGTFKEFFFWNIDVWFLLQATQLSTIEGRNDLGSGRSDTDLVTAKKSLQGKAFTTVCYTADGQCLLAGGQSKNICIYQVFHQALWLIVIE